MILTKIPVKKRNDYYLVITDAHRVGGKVRRRTVKKIGYLSELRKEYDDPIAHFKGVAREMTEKKRGTGGVENVKLDFAAAADPSSTFRTGNIVIQKLLSRFSLGRLFRKKRERTKIKCDLEKVFNFLVVNQILSPSSKLRAFNGQGEFYGAKGIDLHDIYRSLRYIDGISADIQARMFEKSRGIAERNVSSVYYDCTNYYFEIEVEDEFRRFGFSKEHRPNPIVQMGLFIDEDGLPLAMSVNPGNTNEQKTATPLEKRIMRDYRLSRFVYCADAGLGSSSIRRFNSLGDRAYIVTQSLKKLSGKDSELVFRNLSWKYLSDGSDADFSRYKSVCEKAASGAGLTDGEKAVVEKGDVYKDYVSEKGERIIVTFSPKAFAYQRGIFLKQLARAKKMAAGGRMAFGPNDVRRFVFSYAIDGDGEMLENEGLGLDGPKADAEREYHGFYAVATNLEDDVREILRINGFRWKIEDSFRVMKTNFKARPVYHQKSERIQAHFLVCFVSLLIFGLLKLKLGSKEITDGALIGTLRNMSVKIDDKIGYGEALYTHSKTLEELEKAYPLGLNRKYYSSAQLRKISKMKS